MELSKREFFKTVLDQQTRDMVKEGVLTGYMYAGFCLIGDLVLRTFFDIAISPYIGAMIVIVLVMTAGIHLFRSRICAVFLLVYYLADQVLFTISQFLEGEGYLVVARIGVIYVFASGFERAVRGTFEFHRAWKQYRAGQYVSKETQSKPRPVSELPQMPKEKDD